MFGPKNFVLDSRATAFNFDSFYNNSNGERTQRTKAKYKKKIETEQTANKIPLKLSIDERYLADGAHSGKLFLSCFYKLKN